MTWLEYLLYLWYQKGLLFIDESRLDEVSKEDRDLLLKHGYIRIEEDGSCEIVSITKKGIEYLDSVE